MRNRLPALRLDLAPLHRSVKKLIGHLPPETQYKLLRGMPRGCTALLRPSRPRPAHDRGQWRAPLSVDREMCMGSGVCIVFAPGTFAHDADTKAIVLEPAGDPGRTSRPP